MHYFQLETSSPAVEYQKNQLKKGEKKNTHVESSDRHFRDSNFSKVTLSATLQMGTNGVKGIMWDVPYQFIGVLCDPINL